MSWVDEVLEKQVKERWPWQKEFIQAVTEFVNAVRPVLESDPKYKKHAILERIIVPERTIIFRVTWERDNGDIEVNYGYRIQMNSALGPYKGGLRFHPTVNLSVLKFLAFEQIFKNSLTGLPLGGGKGGSNFDPKGKSDDEVRRFCQAFMTELYRHVGSDIDVPAGDIGVGAREIGYLFGQYKKIANLHDGGVLTGKTVGWGGSLIRPEATGYGCVYFAEEMLKTKGDSIGGKRVLISGSGNVAQYAAEKVNQLGGKVISLSDSGGTVIDEDGISGEKWEYVMELKNVKRGRIKEYVEKFPTAKYYEGKRPWGLAEAEIAMPCATQNELDLDDAKALVKNGCMVVAEGSNMPTTLEATDYLLENKVLFAPGKASNAGGVATSGLEMSQNSMRLFWTKEEVDSKLHNIMVNIHQSCLDAAKEFGHPGNYVVGANIAGFLRVAKAMIDQGF
ncbi:Glutamate dehydrogenase (NADP(+)) [Thermovirga lienii DSM 17291]|uniref:Glutamate dehydrogenase n=1 Tax=Thermovirga lienii (strain ATCC BAA-1197 / DSM 17291 / Cas60314) TaxID=580340 RepID=G7V9K5_THELD|nr:NADP-specific glutamate dehydrogenase [Thermovirga lienii]AER66555.1 Glutamate dehydrogenase (NADP(+)) [Thermovirga lienii DSM 17291]